MATVAECRTAIDELAAMLSAVDEQRRRKHVPDRSLSLHVMDHDIFFRARLHDGELVDIHETTAREPKANIRLSMTSDDLVALTRKELSFPHAWATGRVRLDASIRDLLRLRAFA